MIKTKTAFIIFIVLLLFAFPYSIILSSFDSDFLSSIIPGWNTTIYPSGAVVKFFILLFVCIFLWELSKISTDVSVKKAIIYFLLTIPAILAAKLNLYEIFNFNSDNPENLIVHIKVITFITVFINTIFYLGQILFWIYYKKQQKLT
ncbi:hypothetical protein EV144_101732 [Flavobacterium sp. 270]|uniref:hypothetical protein n=1 Tax=Flavobacterium sp. 270 TaxID=2512114 RepID=UPI001064AFD0|nr:hypothetical protein [Flavobacterium sp. 270]TDW52052.1 hypothetical protein EV144_101732 [Flavobacterium sp. 270]